MAKIRDWLDGFLETHVLRYGPHDWPEAGTPAHAQFVADWLRELATLAPPASHDEAMRASESLVLEPPRWKREHIPAIVAAIRAARSPSPTAPQAPRPTADQLDAMQDSAACPECHGTGWASRRILWPALGWAPTVELTCRCPHGRWRRANDPDVLRHRPRNFDDLQAHPELWDPRLASPLWTDAPAVVDLAVAEGTEGLWHYLAPGQPAPRREALPVARLTQPARLAHANRAAQWAQSSDPVLRADGERALAAQGAMPEAGETPGKAPGVPAVRSVAPRSTDGAPHRPRPAARPLPPWETAGVSGSSGDDWF